MVPRALKIALDRPEHLALLPHLTKLADTKTADGGQLDAVRRMHELGYRVSLAGGIGPATLEAVLAVEPEILVVGSAITASDDPTGVAGWIRDRLRNPGRGWPWDKK
jgi:3-keto-L-gulonate-6-phosphate decarboxylase